MSTPWTTDAAVAWVLGPGHLSCLDAEGHPLGERASPRYARTAADEERRTFGDRRDATGLPCNIGALAQVRAAWPSILELVASYERDAAPTLGRALRRAEAATAIAPLLALSGATVSVAQAALYKATVGFGEVLAAALVEQWADADDPPPDDVGFFAWLDARPFLIGERQVCAGSRGHIRRLFDALATGDSAAGERPPVAETAIAALRTLHALVAAAAGAARPHLLEGRGDTEATCARLYQAREVPSRAAALRRVSDAGAAHATLFFGAADVPAELRGFLDALPAAATTRDPLAAIDDALLATMRPVAARLVIECGLTTTEAPLTLAGIRAVCGD